jgi:hypothetical protein
LLNNNLVAPQAVQVLVALQVVLALAPQRALLLLA